VSIYRVANGTSVRLVDAKNRAQALAHVAHDIKVDVPSQRELVELVQAGKVVESAGEHPENPSTN